MTNTRNSKIGIKSGSCDLLLINPYPVGAYGINEATVEVPLGILYIASFLRSHGFKISIIDANVLKMSVSDVVEKVKLLSPKIVGISINAFSFSVSLNYIKNIKKISKDIAVIIGGAFATSVPRQCLEDSQADAVVVGEGELTMLEIMNNWLQNKDLFNTVKGVLYRNNSNIINAEPRDRIDNLDVLPFPAYDLLPSLKLYKSRARKSPTLGIITSRGCPYRCIYCSKDVFKNKIILRSANNVVEEISYLTDRLGVRQINILDDNFTFDRERVEKICNLLTQKKYRVLINLQSGIRADSVDDQLLRGMHEAGVFKIAFGIETGDANIMKTIKKGLDLNKALIAASLARKNGIIVIGFFMIGFPADTPATLQKTIDFAKMMNPHIANFMLTVPFYGTELYNIIKDKGKMLIDTKRGIRFGFYSTQPYFEFDDLSSNLLLYYYKKAYRDFYCRTSKILDILKTIKSINELKWFSSAIISTILPIMRDYFRKERHK